jgi:hypothetical protein
MLAKRKLALWAAILIAVVLCTARGARAEDAPSLEYKVKAAFLYNFLKFIEWPAESAPAAATSPITIGILGDDKFGTAFTEITSRKIKDRSITVRKFTDFNTDEARAGLPKCHLIFVSANQEKYTKDILALLQKKPVLTVGETAGFLEAGGMINFIMQESKVCFEVNEDATAESTLKMASQLMRLAKRVIDKDAPATKSSNAMELMFRQTRGA